MNINETHRELLSAKLKSNEEKLKWFVSQIKVSIEKLNDKDLSKEQRKVYQGYLDRERILSVLTESRIQLIQKMLKENTFKATCLDMWDD